MSQCPGVKIMLMGLGIEDNNMLGFDIEHRMLLSTKLPKIWYQCKASFHVRSRKHIHENYPPLQCSH